MDLSGKVLSEAGIITFSPSPPQFPFLKWGRRGTGGKPVCIRPAFPTGFFIPFCSRCSGEEAGPAWGPRRPSQPALHKLSVEVPVGASGIL